MIFIALSDLDVYATVEDTLERGGEEEGGEGEGEEEGHYSPLIHPTASSSVNCTNFGNAANNFGGLPAAGNGGKTAAAAKRCDNISIRGYASTAQKNRKATLDSRAGSRHSNNRTLGSRERSTLDSRGSSPGQQRRRTRGSSNSLASNPLASNSLASNGLDSNDESGSGTLYMNRNLELIGSIKSTFIE